MKAVNVWLLLLCGFLLLWQPVSVGLAAAGTLDAVMIRGFPAMLLLLVRLLMTAIGIGAGLALLGRRPGAVGFARLSLLASGATDLLIYLTPYVPNHRAPGETPVWVAATIVVYGGWVAYLTLATRVPD